MLTISHLTSKGKEGAYRTAVSVQECSNEMKQHTQSYIIPGSTPNLVTGFQAILHWPKVSSSL